MKLQFYRLNALNGQNQYTPHWNASANGPEKTGGIFVFHALSRNKIAKRTTLTMVKLRCYELLLTGLCRLATDTALIRASSESAIEEGFKRREIAIRKHQLKYF